MARRKRNTTNINLRQAVISEFKLVILNYLYARPQKMHRDIISNIAKENSILHSTTSFRFHYKSKIWGTYLPQDASLCLSLHSSLREKANKVINEIEALDKEAEYVSNFISRLLSQSISLEEVFKVLPTCVHAAISSKRREHSEYMTTTDKITHFEINEYDLKAIELIKQRMAINLILGK